MYELRLKQQHTVILDFIRYPRLQRLSCTIYGRGKASSCYSILPWAFGTLRKFSEQLVVIIAAVMSTPIGSHDSDSLLGTTRVVSRARMLMYWAGSSQTASPRERRPK